MKIALCLVPLLALRLVLWSLVLAMSLALLSALV